MEESRDPSSDLRADARTRLVLGALLAGYALCIGLLVASDQIGSLGKSLVIPSLLLAAALVGRVRPFLRDWSVFLGAVVLFDSLRALTYALVVYFELPVYMNYAIDADALLFGVASPIHVVQAWFGASQDVDAFDRLMGVAYASHFLAFLAFGLTLWMLRPAAFRPFALAMLVMMYAGLLGYGLVPTVPPWMALDHYQVMDPFVSATAEIFKGALPTLTTAFDTNPIAAMPSLHCAFAAMLVLFALREFRWWGLALLAYASCLWLSTVYLGAHYVVDVLAGIALAAVVYFAVTGGWGDRLRAGFDRLLARPLSVQVGIALALGIATQAVALAGWSLSESALPQPTPAFVARELAGRSPLADYHAGRAHFHRDRLDDARHALERALASDLAPATRRSAQEIQLQTVYRLRDWLAVAASAESLVPLPLWAGMMQVEALAQLGRLDAGLALLDELSRQHPELGDVDAMKAALRADAEAREALAARG